MLYELITRLSVKEKKKYPANIAKGNDIRYLDNKVLANAGDLIFNVSMVS